MEDVRTTTKIISKLCPTCSFTTGGDDPVQICPIDGSLLAAQIADPYLDRTLLERFRIESWLGAGGFGAVYKAQHLGLRKTVAIKILRTELMHDPKKVKRFQIEAQSASALAHPNIATVYDYGLLPEGNPYLAMEYVDGCNLVEKLSGGSISAEEAVQIVIQAAAGLAAAHSQGVIHRDIKPNNVMISTSGVVKILDFGIAKILEPDADGAKLTQTGDTVGTPDYMSPEQCTGQTLDARSDVYSLGLVLYYALTGRSAISGKTPFEAMQKHLYETPAPPATISNSVEEALYRALEKDPEQRYQSMDAFGQALQAALKQTGNRRKPALRKPKWKKLPYQSIHSMLVSTVAALVLILAGIVYYKQIQSTESNQVAQPNRQVEQVPVKELDLSSRTIDPKLLHQVSAIGNYTRLNLADSDVQPGAVAIISRMVNVSEIDFSQSGIKDRDIVQLSGLPKLEVVLLRRTQVKGPGLCGLRNVTFLDLSHSSVEDQGLQFIPGKIKSLNIFGTDVTGVGLKYLAKMKHLKELKTSVRLTAEDWRNLSNLQQLEVLNLSNSKANGNVVNAVIELKHLKKLSLTGTEIDPADLARLRQALPNCEIIL